MCIRDREQLLAWSADDSALPLDRPNDTNYRIAVAALKDASNDAFLLDEIPAPGAPPTEAASVSFDDEAGSAVEDVATPPRPALPPYLLLALVLGIPAVVVLLSLCLATMAWLIFVRH